MEEGEAISYWCHMCSQIVNPIMEIEMKCPFCQSGFVEEMSSSRSSTTIRDHDPDDPDPDPDPDLGSDRALSLWAPILLGMMGHPSHHHRRRHHHRRFRREELEDDDDDEDDDRNSNSNSRAETELDRELESFIRRRRRSSATILQLLQGIRAGIVSESTENSESDRERERERERERVILINPFNQTIIVQGSYDPNQPPQNHHPAASLGDYFIGPGLDLLLQHLAENDPNRYGTPPAQKQAIEAMPTVTIEENLQCSVCLDDFEVGAKAKEMPCNHKFHSGCILPWLELHSSCPVCRFQIPADDDHDQSKLDSDGPRNSSNNDRGESNNGHGSGGEEADGDGRNGSGRRFSVPIPWPFNGLFSSSGSQTSGGGGGGGNSSSTPSSSANAPGSAASHTDEN